jgi:hypothetical protein
VYYDTADSHGGDEYHESDDGVASQHSAFLLMIGGDK